MKRAQRRVARLDPVDVLPGDDYNELVDAVRLWKKAAGAQLPTPRAVRRAPAV